MAGRIRHEGLGMSVPSIERQGRGVMRAKDGNEGVGTQRHATQSLQEGQWWAVEAVDIRSQGTGT
jgi:hypothetical protein